MRDNVKARILDAQGNYTLRSCAPGEEPVNAHEWMLKHRGIWNQGIHDETEDMSISRDGI
jgi:hypothetical protein